MNRSVNKTILVGNVGRDPDVRESQDGTKIAHASLATRRPNKGATSETHEHTDWHRLTFRARLASFVEEHVHKGDRIYVEGRIQYDTYERDGVTIPTAEILVRELVLLRSERGEVPA